METSEPTNKTNFKDSEWREVPVRPNMSPVAKTEPHDQSPEERISSPLNKHMQNATVSISNPNGSPPADLREHAVNMVKSEMTRPIGHPESVESEAKHCVDSDASRDVGAARGSPIAVRQESVTVTHSLGQHQPHHPSSQPQQAFHSMGPVLATEDVEAFLSNLEKPQATSVSVSAVANTTTPTLATLSSAQHISTMPPVSVVQQRPNNSSHIYQNQPLHLQSYNSTINNNNNNNTENSIYAATMATRPSVHPSYQYPPVQVSPTQGNTMWSMPVDAFSGLTSSGRYTYPCQPVEGTPQTQEMYKQQVNGLHPYPTNYRPEVTQYSSLTSTLLAGMQDPRRNTPLSAGECLCH